MVNLVLPENVRKIDEQIKALEWQLTQDVDIKIKSIYERTVRELKEHRTRLLKNTGEMEKVKSKLDNVYTAKESAVRLKCSVCSIYELVQEHKIRAIRIGRKILISETALAEFINGTGEES